MAEIVYCDRKWRFSNTFDESMISTPISNAEIVNIPHTVKETPLSYFDEGIYQIISCYQKSIFAPKQWEGNIVEITFEAVGHMSDVYVNGKHLKHHNCGYTAFTIDVSDELKFGEENLITVRVDSNENINQPPFGYVIDYMTYGGIYRDVYFSIKPKMHIKDCFVRPMLLEKISTSKRTSEQIRIMKVQGIIKTDVLFSLKTFDATYDENAFVQQYIDDKLIISQPVTSIEKTDDGYLQKLITAPLTVKLWDIESPHCYTVTTKLVINDQVVDEQSYSVGFRRSEFRKEGYFLNGRRVILRGLNRHQSYPYVGYAMPESMQRHDARILKDELAVNAVRTSHYPQSHYFLDECDKIGLLVFTEIPGWQHIGNDEWKDIAVENTRDMILQYRNHPSIILWGVRINESKDDDEFYTRTNEIAHSLDDTRPTGGVRAHAKSNLLEDVYTYNDFVHSGRNEGCQPKKKVTSDESKPYLVSEFNGHMYPTKSFDTEEHRRNHALRHAKVLNDVASEQEIAGCFGWCMFDYNTHKDFGSGDRICYHGIMDMFRNPKMASLVYQSFSKNEPVLDVSSSFDIGEHPACNRGETYIFSNADSVRMYKNDNFIKEYFPSESKYSCLKHGPILIDDFVGNALYESGDFTKKQSELISKALNHVALNGYEMTLELVWTAIRLVVFHRVSPSQAVPIYNKYVGDWGGESRSYKFEAIKNGEVVKTVVKAPASEVHMSADASHTLLTELHTYDTCAIRIKALDQNDNQLFYFNEPVTFSIDGPFEIVGPKTVSFLGGATGTYVKSIGEDGDGRLIISCSNLEPLIIPLSVECLSK